MTELEEIVQEMLDAGASQESITGVIEEYELQNPVPKTPLNLDQGEDGQVSRENSTSSSADGELVYGDQRNLDTQIKDYNRLKKDLLDAKGQYDTDYMNSITVEEREKYLQYIPQPGYVANKSNKPISERTDLDQEMEITEMGKRDLDIDIAESQASWDNMGEQITDGLSLEEIYVEKSDYIFNDLVKNNKYLNKYLQPEIIATANTHMNTPQPGLGNMSPLEDIKKTYGLDDGEWTPDELEEANTAYNKERNLILQQAAENSPQYMATLQGISDIAKGTVRDEVMKKMTQEGRDNMEFKLPFTDITLYKGVSDFRFLEGLQQFGKTTTQAAYGLELMTADSLKAKDASEEIKSINDKLENGDLSLEDEIDYDMTKNKLNRVGKKKGTVKEALAFLNSTLNERQEEQVDTLKDINKINEDLTLFTKSELFDEDGITFGDVSQLLGSQVPQLALAYFGGGLGITLQEIGSTYTQNLDLVTRKKFNTPENQQPTVDQLKEVINSNEDEVGTALLTGVAVGQLERFSANKLLGTGKAGKKVLGSLLRGEVKLALNAGKQTIKKAGSGGVTEYITEGLQTGLSQLSGTSVSGESQFDFKELKEAAGVGGLIGTIIPTSVSLAKQTGLEFKTAAMKIASADSNMGRLEQSFKTIEQRINNDKRFNESTKRQRILALGQIRNKLGSIPKDYSPNQKQKSLELLIRKEDLLNQYKDVDEKLIPKDVKDQIKNIDKEISKIAQDAYITKTVDMAQRDGIGENILTAKTSKEADKLAAENNISMTDDKGGRSEGGFSLDGKTVIIDLEQAKKVKAFNVAGHEVLHRILFNTLYKNIDGKIVGTDVARSLGIELDKELNKIDASLLKNEYLKARFKLYKDQGKTMQAEEKLTILSDALRLGQINLDENALDKFNSYFRRLFQNLGFKSIKFKDGKSVVNFIKDYNVSLDKGKTFGKAILQGEKEGFEVVRGKDGIKKLKDDITTVDQKNSISNTSTNNRLSAFDFDDTLFKTNSEVIVNKPDGSTYSLTAAKFASHTLGKGEKYDFAQFDQVIKPEALEGLNKLKNKLAKGDDVTILTARNMRAGNAVMKLMNEYIGKDADKIKFIGVGSSKAEAKATYLTRAIKKYGYNNVFFTDDAVNNVDVAKDVLSKIPGLKSEVVQATPDSTIKLSKSTDIDALVGDVTKAQWDATEADKAINKAVPKLEGLIKSKIPANPPPGFSKEDFVQGTIVELIPHMRNFNPEINDSFSGWINSQLSNKIGNVFKKNEAATKQEFETDVTEAKNVIQEESTIEAPKKTKSKLRRALKIDDKLIDKVKGAVRKTLGTKLPPVDSPKFKQALKKAFRTELKVPLANLLGTRAKYETFLKENFNAIYDAIPQETLNKRFKQFIEATGEREKTAQGNAIFNKRRINQQEFIDYFLGSDIGASTKGTRKDALAETLGEIMALDATMEVAQEPETKTKREAVAELQGQKVTEADTAKMGVSVDRDPAMKFSISEGTQRLIDNPKFDLELGGRSKVNSLLKSKTIEETLDLKTNVLTTDGRKKIIDTFRNEVLVLGPKAMWFGKNGTGAPVFTKSNADYGISMSKENNGKYKFPKEAAAFNQLKNDFIAVREDPNTIYGKEIKGVTDYTVSSYSIIFKNPATIEKNLNDGAKNKLSTIEAWNKKNSIIHKELWKRINNIISKDKNKASGIATYLKLVANDTKHWHRLGAGFVAYSNNPVGIKGTLYEYEHAMPATSAYLYLLDVVIDKGNFDAAYEAVMDNYKLIALDKAENAKLGKAGLGRGMPKGWMLGQNFWWQRYFNSEVSAIDGGIPPSSIMFTNNKTIADELKINSTGEYMPISLQESKSKASISNNNMLPIGVKFNKSQEYNNQSVLDLMTELDETSENKVIKFSKSQDLSKDFNDIIENKTGIGSDKQYAKVKAQVAGAGKGKFQFFVPPSAEDFVGLLYATLGKGKIGDSQMAWYRTNLIIPFSRAIDNLNRDRLTLMNDYKALKKDLKIVPKNLRKKLPGEPFTREQAVRVYVWNKQGLDVPGLSRTDLKELTSFVEENKDLKVFADQLIDINKGDKYAPPKDFWTSGTISTDLIEGLNTIKRAKYLELWQQNANEIFSTANLNKLEAAYGKPYRDALENMLQRMKTGRNRTFAGDGLTARVTDWLTNSVGAIMFFNTRSAILQTISSINFINFSDNNPLRAGAALLNAPQYGKDFIKLMNSPFLLARRDGLKINVNEADISEMAKDPANMARRFVAKTLRLGFLPTQIADSFAIASGGATFYRNRIRSLTKQGMDPAAAEKQAMLDFIELAEESQQSSRPDRISQQQAGPLGRVILAFANTPMQYTRLIKKAASDLKNGRGDAKTNISKILYYGVAQNLIFNALQQALFAIAFDEEEEEEEKQNERAFNIVNSMSDQFLRGAGVGGAIVSTLKNTVLKLIKQSEKNNPKYAATLIEELAQISPPVGSKIRKLSSAGRSFEWNKKEMMEKGWSLDNPAYMAGANIISAGTNLPLDRVIKKIDNITNANNAELETWQRVASAGGWSKWQLGIQKKKKKTTSFKKVKKSKKLIF